MPVKRLYNPKVVEPAHGRRKARYECPIEGCREVIICTRLMCRDHWKMVPTAQKKKNESTYREHKEALSDSECVPQLRGFYRRAHLYACQHCIEAVEEKIL